MALINCKNCGQQISDKARTCPKCGAPNLANQPHYTPPENDPDDDDDDGGSTGHTTLYVVLILLVIGIIGGIAYYVYSTNQANEKIEQEQRRINDSSAAAQLEAERLEAARLDSIRQDSIDRRNFTSPDLMFFDLHGPVKSVSYSAAPSKPTDDDDYRILPVPDCALFKTTHFQFSRDGKLIDKRKLFDLDEPDGEYLYRWNFNADGFPSEGVYNNNGGCPTQYWKYYPNGQLKESYNGYGSHFVEVKYTYNTQHNLTQIDATERGNMGMEHLEHITIKITGTDMYGNWTSRILTTQIIDRIDWIEEYGSLPNGFNIIRHEDGYSRCERKQTETRTEKRTITYY